MDRLAQSVVLPGVDVAAAGQRKQNKLWKPSAIERFRHTDRCPIEGPASVPATVERKPDAAVAV
jgi:hypothetical protein